MAEGGGGRERETGRERDTRKNYRRGRDACKDDGRERDARKDYRRGIDARKNRVPRSGPAPGRQSQSLYNR